MKRDRTLGKFMERNSTPIYSYMISMCLVITVPFQFGNYLTIQLGGITLFTSMFIGYLNYQQGQDRLFKDLFKEFNERYDKINDHYLHLQNDYEAANQIDSVSPADLKIIIDYLNLCAEEFFWFEKGRIEESAWISWVSGMETWAAMKAVKIVYYSEVSTWTTSYYTGFQDFFENLIIKTEN